MTFGASSRDSPKRTLVYLNYGFCAITKRNISRMYPLFCACTSTNLSVDFLIPALNSPRIGGFRIFMSRANVHILCHFALFCVFLWLAGCVLFVLALFSFAPCTRIRVQHGRGARASRGIMSGLLLLEVVILLTQ